MSISATLHSSEEKSTSSAPVSSTWKPGRRMTSAPKKPRKMAVQRRQRNTSPRKRALNRAVNSGAVKESAVARAIGVSERPTKNATIENTLSTARSTCRLEPLGVEEAEPVAHEQGRDHDQAEQVAEEGHLDGRQMLGGVPDGGVHGGEHAACRAPSAAQPRVTAEGPGSVLSRGYGAHEREELSHVAQAYPLRGPPTRRRCGWQPSISREVTSDDGRMGPHQSPVPPRRHTRQAKRGAGIQRRVRRSSAGLDSRSALRLAGMTMETVDERARANRASYLRRPVSPAINQHNADCLLTRVYASVSKQRTEGAGLASRRTDVNCAAHEPRCRAGYRLTDPVHHGTGRTGSNRVAVARHPGSCRSGTARAGTPR